MGVVRQRTPGARRRGAVAPLVAVCLTVMIGVAALTIDGGLLMSDRRQVQSAADAAALAAAVDLYNNYSTNNGLDPAGKAADSAKSVAKANGYTNDGTTSVVTVNIPPTSGTFSGTSAYAEVIVKYYENRAFSALWGSAQLTVSARAVAHAKHQPSSTALYVLDPSANKAFNFTAAGNLRVPNGKISIDSSDSDAADNSGGGAIYTQEADIVGNTNRSSYFVTSPTANQVFTGKSSVSDPLSSLAVPSIPSASYSPPNNINSNTTLNPGYYASGISISNGNVTLNSGLYYLQGGGFSVSGGTVTGTGVTLYLDPSGSNGMDVSGGVLTLSAQTSGTYSGILVFERRDTNNKQLKFSQSQTCTLTGTVYAPNSEFYTSNSGTLTISDLLICRTAKVTGGADFNINGGAGSTSTTKVRLVE